MHFNSETDTDTSARSDKKAKEYHEVIDDEVVTFDNTTVKLLQKMHVKSKWSSFS